MQLLIKGGYYIVTNPSTTLIPRKHILIFPKFQTNFARPTPAVLNPVANVNAKNAEGAPAGAGQDQSFYNNFQAQENDPFQDIASE